MAGFLFAVYNADNMYYSVSSWQKLAPNVYDAGGKIVFIKQKFLTTQFAVFIGGLLTITPAAYLAVLYFNNSIEEALPLLAIGAIELPVGIWMLMSGIKGKKLREEMGGVHPTDTVYTLDTWGKDLRKRIGDIEEYLSALDQVSFEIKTDHNKNSTTYRLQLTWPNGNDVVHSTNSKKNIETLIVDIRQRLGLAPMEPPQS